MTGWGGVEDLSALDPKRKATPTGARELVDGVRTLAAVHRQRGVETARLRLGRTAPGLSHHAVGLWS